MFDAGRDDPFIHFCNELIVFDAPLIGANSKPIRIRGVFIAGGCFDWPHSSPSPASSSCIPIPGGIGGGLKSVVGNPVACRMRLHGLF